MMLWMWWTKGIASLLKHAKYARTKSHDWAGWDGSSFCVIALSASSMIHGSPTSIVVACFTQFLLKSNAVYLYEKGIPTIPIKPYFLRVLRSKLLFESALSRECTDCLRERVCFRRAPQP